jgi:NAD(P)-dependent dehydrogenase (short-subunit alcohol dehydrogenase family)
MTVLLSEKNIIIYGPSPDGIGGPVAATFAREGANLFLAGRTRETLEAVAAQVADAGGRAEVAIVDALDERAVDEHARAVADSAGSVDVSFNLVSRGDVQGIPLVDMTWEDFDRPVTTGLRATFNTARSAARLMAAQGSGVILSLTSGSAKGTMPGMGGTGPADAATEAFLRYLAAEVGPAGVRVVGIYTAGVVETLTRAKITDVNAEGPDPEQIIEMLSGMALLRKAPRVAEVCETAAFLASDRASGITATTANVTCGLVVTP